MLITPPSGRADLRNPPVITLIIILVNVLIYVLFQSSDRRIYEQAREYYLSSGLAAIEAAAYEQYREYGAVVGLPASRMGDPSLHGKQAPLLHDMHKDGQFMDRLGRGQVITPEMEAYSSWKNGRVHLDKLFSSTTVMRYGFVPAARDLDSAIFHMVFHNGPAGLMAGMILLWLVGYVLEPAFGRTLYAALYVLGGLFAAVLYWLACSACTAPLVGASGSVALLMGAYAVLYGRQKVRLFYPAGWRLGNATVPGGIVLALWVASELFQFWLAAENRAVYPAYLGCFGCGVAVGFAHRLIPGAGKKDHPGPEPDPGLNAELLLDKAIRREEKLDTQGARYLLGEVLKLDPRNRTALTRKYHLDKADAGCGDLHSSAGRLLALLVDDRQAHQETLAVYREYIRTAKKPRLPVELLFSLSSYFAATGHLEESEKIMGLLLKKKPDLPKMPQGLLHLARACLRDGLEGKARSYLQVICMRYPLSGEFATARRILDDLDGLTPSQTRS